jgi:hypothetical protein
MARGSVRRGGTLVAALAFVLVTSLLVSGGLSWVASHRSLTWSRSSSEAALLLAEGALNDELHFIGVNAQNPVPSLRSSAPTENGEGVPLGRNGTLPDVDGQFWVFSCQPRANPDDVPVAWSGSGPVEIEATAIIRGARRTLRIRAMTQSIFGLFASFALGEQGSNNHVISPAGSAMLDIVGLIGTNGIVQGGQGQISYTGAINANYTVTGGTSQFTVPPIFIVQPRIEFPSVAQVARFTFYDRLPANLRSPSTSSDDDIYNWLRQDANNDNHQMRRYVAGASSETLSSDNTEPIPNVRNAFVSGNNGPTFVNTSGNNRGGPWHNTYVPEANAKPGTSGVVRTVILPPGDYVFRNVDLSWHAQTEFVVDNGGLSAPLTAERPAVRIWVVPTGNNDKIATPIVGTKEDSGTFRLFYAKAGRTFSFERSSQYPSNQPYITRGAVYAVVPGNASINFVGLNNAANSFTLMGSLLANSIRYTGHSQIIFTQGDNMGDIGAGAGFTGGYVEVN